MTSKQKKRIYSSALESIPIFKNWIERNGEKAHCKYCDVDLRPHRTALKKHATTTKHIRNVRCQKSGQRKNNSKPSDEEIEKDLFLRMALTVATEPSQSFSCVTDLLHLTEIVTEKKLDFNGTKCVALVKNVLAPHFKDELLREVSETPFSLILKGSVYSSEECDFIISYFSDKMKEIITTFLASEAINDSSPAELVQAVKRVLEIWSLKEENLVSVGTYGALPGIQGFREHLGQTWPHVLHLRCVDGAVDHAALEATKNALPLHIDYMVERSKSWFALSYVRQLKYPDVAAKMGFTNDNSDYDEEEDFCAILNALNGREVALPEPKWLESIAGIIDRVVTHYDDLKTHFSIAYIKEHCYDAEMLFGMFEDESNRSYLTFLRPILLELADPDLAKNVDRLESFFISLAKQILEPSIWKDKSAEDLCYILVDAEKLLPVQNVHFDKEFEKNLGNANFLYEKKTEVQASVASFLKELFVELQPCLETALTQMKNLGTITNPNFLEKSLKRQDLIAPFFPQDDESWTKVEETFQRIKTWTNPSAGNNLWPDAHSYQDQTGNYPFRNLSSGVVKILCLPIANVDKIEKTFSQIDLMKVAKNLPDDGDVISAILHCKFGLGKFGLTVGQFDPPASILNYSLS